MCSSVIKVCVIIAYLGFLLIDRVESIWNAEGNKVFIPIGGDSKPIKFDYVIPNYELVEGKPLFEPPKRKSESTINGEVVQNWKRADGEVVFKLPNSTFHPVYSRVDYVIPHLEQDNGEPVFIPPKRKSESTIYTEAVQTRKDNDVEAVFTAPNHALQPSNPNYVDAESFPKGNVVFSSEETLSNPSVAKPRALRNGARRETSRWYPRTSEMNLPLYYY